jgi:uracil phosphoribosyltransferase
MPFLNTIDHPLVKHHLTSLRTKSTECDPFRQLVRRLAVLLAFEATKDLKTQAQQIETPLEVMTGNKLSQRIGLVPILRAGLGMVDPILDLIPEAEVWHLGLYRDEATAQPVEYYSKLPQQAPVDVGLIVDPMLATGGSASSAVSALKTWGVPKIKLLSIIAAPEGVESMQREHGDIEIYVCAVDRHLNNRKFIVPGLGDAGDRIFNTSR